MKENQTVIHFALRQTNSTAKLLLVTFASLFHEPSQATNTSFCLTTDVIYFDAGIGTTHEDYWAETGLNARPPRGARLKVIQNGLVKFDDFTHDGIGANDAGLACTPIIDLATPGTVTLSLTTQGEIGGVPLEVRDGSALTAVSPTLTPVFSTLPFGQITKTFSASAGLNSVDMGEPSSDTDKAAFEVYQAISYGLYRHVGAQTTAPYEVVVNQTGPCGNSCFGGTPARNWFNGAGNVRTKFLVLHEFGHNLLNRTGFNGGDVDPDEPAPCEGDPPGQVHSMRSMEFVRRAISEGFPNFYAADVFNNHYEDDCRFTYWKPISNPATNLPISIDCEWGNTGTPFENNWMSNCGESTAGKGTQLDWMRHLWDLHTDGVNPPSFSEIYNLMDDTPSSSLTNSNAYTQLDRCANNNDGCSVPSSLTSIWNSKKVNNGVAH